MGTTIDSLQIEIQSNSTNAASSIEALAKALKKLNNAGTNLDGFKRAMGSLKDINVKGVAPQIERIAKALTPLNNVKGSGFNAMMNGLKKLDEVVDGLDSASIDRFVAKIKELDEKLEPVSEKLVAVGNAFKGANSNALTASGGFSVFGGKLNTTTLNLKNLISVAKNVWSVLKRIPEMIEKTMGDAIEWDGIAQRFGRGFGDQAEEVYSWIQRLNQEMGINTQQFMQYSSTYATMLTGFGVASKDASKMALGYMELTYDIWSGYNDIYKSLDDAATAVRSAIAGEVEPVRKAGFTIIESTLEQTAANHGLKISLEKATEAQKSYLRYLTLVDQAKAQGLVGNYARELDTAEGAMRTFNQQLKSLGQTFGSVFLPALVKVMPWISAFIDLVGDAIIMAANLFGLDIQKVNFGSSISYSADSATESVNGTTAAVKELKNATTGIDELNVISPQSGGGGGASVSGGGFDGLDVGSLWDQSLLDGIKSETDEIKQKFKDWLGITDDINSWADLFKTKLGGILIVVGLIGAALVVWKIIESIANVVDVLGKLKGAGGKNKTPDVDTGNTGGGLSKTTEKLKTLVKDLALGLVVVLEVVAAAALFVGGIWLLGVELEQVGIAWEPVIANGETIAIAMGIGTALLVAVGAAAYGLGTLGKSVAVNIGIGIAILAEMGIAAGLFIAEIIGIGILLNEVYEAWDPVLDNGKDVASAIGLGTALLIGVGVVAAALGAATVATAGALPLAIALGTALLVELAVAFVAFTESLVEVADQLKDELYPAMDGANEILPELRDDTRDFTSFMRDFAGEVVSYTASSAIAGIAASIDKFISFFTTDPIKRMADKVSDQKGKLDTLVKNLKKVLPVLKNADSLLGQFNDDMSDLKAKIGADGKSSGTIGYVISIGVSLVKKGWSSIKSWLGGLDFNLSFKLPKIGIKWDEKTVAGFKIKWPSSFYTYAKGGFPDIGEMFVAREAGPELVGTIGNRNAVVNNDQIVESVSQGVYQAVVAAMRASNGNGGGQAVNVYLDGKQITASVEQRQKERGASLMGNQVYSY